VFRFAGTGAYCNAYLDVLKIAQGLFTEWPSSVSYAVENIWTFGHQSLASQKSQNRPSNSNEANCEPAQIVHENDHKEAAKL